MADTIRFGEFAPRLAAWPSGKAEDCKSFTPSSNLGAASFRTGLSIRPTPCVGFHTRLVWGMGWAPGRRYGAFSDRLRPMQALLSALLIGWGLVVAPTALACEKHLDGHQTGGDTQAEVQSR